MSNKELREWLGLTLADLLFTFGAIAIAVMFFVSHSVADLALAIVGMGLVMAACPLGMKPNPELSRFTNVVKLVSYPVGVLLAFGVIAIHYIWFNR